MDSKRHIVRLLRAACRMMWGFPPSTIPLIVEAKGTAGSLRWFAANMPRYLVTVRVLGPVRVHLACMIVSLRSGCLYCAHGHAYALELLHLRDRGKLLPLDARDLSGWLSLDDRALRLRLRAVLAESGLHVEALWADRVIDLALGTEPMDSAEARLAHVVRMVGEINAIAMAGDLRPEGAQNPVNKDAAVKARHAELRAAAASA